VLPLLLLFPFPESATLVYRKIFRDSSPEFTEIKIREDSKGTCEIRQLDDLPDAQPFEVIPQLSAKMFELAR
jgi:hypothetical protein